MDFRDILIEEAATDALMTGPSIDILYEVIVDALYNNTIQLGEWDRDPESNSVHLIYVSKNTPLLTENAKNDG